MKSTKKFVRIACVCAACAAFSVAAEETGGGAVTEPETPAETSTEPEEPEVPAEPERVTATLKPGSTSYTKAESWDIGEMPNGDWIDVVIDGDDSVDSSVTLSDGNGDLDITNRVLTVGEGDVFTLKSTGKDSDVYLSAAAVTNSGSLVIDAERKRNGRTVQIKVSGTLYNASTAKLCVNNNSGSTYHSQNRRFYCQLDGSENHGVIEVLLGANGQYDSCQLCLERGGLFLNNGVIHASVSGHYKDSKKPSGGVYFNDAESVCLNGTGLIWIDADELSATNATGYITVQGSGNNIYVTNGVNHSIIGNGIVSSMCLQNQGLLKACGTNRQMTVSLPKYRDVWSWTKAMMNDETGRIVADSPKGLYIGSDSFSGYNTRFYNRGLLESRAGSFIRFANGVNTTSTRTNGDDLPAMEGVFQLWGTIAGGGRIETIKPIHIEDGTILSPGDLENEAGTVDGTGVTTCGTLSFTSNVVMKAGCTNVFQFAKAGRFDALHVGGTLKVDGTLKVLGKPHGGTYRMITADCPIASDNETLFAAFDMSEAEGARPPRLKLGSETIQVAVEKEVTTETTDETTGEVTSTTETVTELVDKIVYYVDATFSDGFNVFVR